MTGTATRQPTAVRGAAAVGYAAAAALATSAIWYGLLTAHVTVASPPVPAVNDSADASMYQYYQWFVTTLPQERIDSALAIAGMLCLGLVGVNLARRFARGLRAATIGAYALGVGGASWSVGNLVQLGGHRAVGLMATHGNPIETVNAINFTVDMIDDAFELAAVVLLGFGLLSFVSAAMRRPAMRRPAMRRPAIRRPALGSAWTTYTFGAGLAMLALAVSYVVGTDDVTAWLLVVAGAVVLPAWIVWTARLSAWTSVPPVEADDATATRESNALRDQLA